MAIPRVVGLFRVSLEWELASPRPVANVFWCQGSRAATTQADADAIGQALADILAVPLATLAWGTAAIPTFAAADYSPEGAYTGVGTVSEDAWDPAGGGTEASSQTCALVSWVTDAPRYRGGHQRTYIGQLAANFLANDSSLEPDQAGTCQTRITDAITALGAVAEDIGGPYALSAVHTTGALEGRVFPITAGTVNLLLATQRRRLRKVARHRTKTT